MIASLDSIALIVCVAVQWRVTVLWLRFARRRFSNAWSWAAACAIAVFDLLLAYGCGVDFLLVLFRPFQRGSFGLIVGTGSLFYLGIAGCILLVRFGKGVLGRRLRVEHNPGRRRFLAATSNLLMAAPCAAIGYGAFVERVNFQVKEVDIPIDGLAADLDGLRILHLSDIHLSAFLSEKDLARVIDASNSLRPNLAVVTGDLISTFGDPLDACIRQIARLKADAGVYGCMGNHEHFTGVERYAERAAARAGIPFLRHSATPLRFGKSTLNLAGVDYQSLHERDRYLRGAESMVSLGAFNVLLSHNPDVFPVAAQQGYDLVLAGHTHGGQVSVEILEQTITPALFLTPYVYGLYRSGSSAEYVTRGIGTIGIPARIGAPPEISILRLRKA